MMLKRENEELKEELSRIKNNMMSKERDSMMMGT